MKKSKVISTVAMCMFAFTLINCSDAKHETRNTRDQVKLDPQSKADKPCKIHTGNPVGQFLNQIKNLKDLRDHNVTGGKIDDHVVVQLNKVRISDQDGVIVERELVDDIKFNTDRAQAQFIKDFLPNGLIQVYSLEDNIAALPEKDCNARSIYEGDLLSINNQSFRVYDANQKAIRGEGAKVIETSSYMTYAGGAKAVAVNNVVETNLNISTESSKIMGNQVMDNFDNRNNILLVREGSIIRTKTSDVDVVVRKHFFIVPKSKLEQIRVALSKQEGTLLKNPIVAAYEKQQSQAAQKKQAEVESENLDEKTWAEISEEPIEFISAQVSKRTSGLWGRVEGAIDSFSFTNKLENQLNRKMTLTQLLDLDKALDGISKEKVKSVETLNFEEQQKETPVEEEKAVEETPTDNEQKTEVEAKETEKQDKEEEATDSEEKTEEQSSSSNESNPVTA